jgi:putative ABC transport system permease protein
MQHSIAGIQHITPIERVYQPGLLRYMGEDYNQATVQGVSASYAQIIQLVLKKGRFLNHRDEAAVRPVCVIGHDIQRILFKKEDPIGKFISVGGHYFRVIGTLDKEAAINRGEQKSVFTSFQTLCKTFNRGTECHEFRISLYPEAVAQTVEQEVRTYLAEQLCFDKSDAKALRVFNFGKETQKFNDLFGGIRTFLWAVGVCLLLSGVMGVSNMVLVSVKERTQEIGIRKVLGASSKEILVMILSESIFISLTSGIVGMVAGLGSVVLVNKVIDYIDSAQNLLIAHLVFKLTAAMAALLLLVMAGAIAGIVPAKRATSILPIKALTTD